METMPRKPKPGEGMLGGLIVDAEPFMQRMELGMYEKIDQLSITPQLKLSAGLKRYPAIWLNASLEVHHLAGRGVKADKLHTLVDHLLDANAVGQLVASLSDEERTALSQLVQADVLVKYQTLSRRYGDETPDTYFWEDKPPTSVIGRLRLYGLVFVGRAQMGARREKVLTVPSDLKAILRGLPSLQGALPPSEAKSPSPAATRKTVVYTLDVSLEDIQPVIWRRITVAADITLSRLERVIQTAMGWSGGHLAEFDIDGECFGDADPSTGTRSAARSHLDQLVSHRGQQFDYIYDFGDSWIHRIKVVDMHDLKPGEVVPDLIDGARACPPEDVGGVPGYVDFVEAISDPTHPEHEDFEEWVGGPWDPDEFDVKSRRTPVRNLGKRGRKT